MHDARYSMNFVNEFIFKISEFDLYPQHTYVNYNNNSYICDDKQVLFSISIILDEIIKTYVNYDINVLLCDVAKRHRIKVTELQN